VIGLSVALHRPASNTLLDSRLRFEHHLSEYNAASSSATCPPRTVR
jgi:hypothetical protein